MKSAAFAAALILFGAGASAAAEFGTSPGIEARTVNRAYFDASCRVIGYPRFEVVTPPANGTLAVRRTPLTLKTAHDFYNCIGKTVEGVAVFYKPKDGFRGVDRFTVRRIRMEGAPEILDVSVLVN